MITPSPGRVYSPSPASSILTGSFNARNATGSPWSGMSVNATVRVQRGLRRIITRGRNQVRDVRVNRCPQHLTRCGGRKLGLGGIKPVQKLCGTSFKVR
jgi:hypothetical protein